MKNHLFCIAVFVLCLGMSQIGMNGQEVSGEAHEASDDASVYFVHGVPGSILGEAPTLPIDIYLDGDRVVSDLKFGQIKGPIKTSAGKYTVGVYRSGMGPGAGYNPLVEEDFTFKDYENASIVGHIDPDELAQLSKFTNDLSLAGHLTKCRIIVHNTSTESLLGYWFYNNVPKYDYHPYLGNDILEPGDKNVLEIAKKNLADPSETFIWMLEIGLGAQNYHAIYDKSFSVKPGRAVLVYLVGDNASKTFKVLKKSIKLK